MNNDDDDDVDVDVDVLDDDDVVAIRQEEINFLVAVTSISKKEATRVWEEYGGNVEAALSWLESDEYRYSRSRGIPTANRKQDDVDEDDDDSNNININNKLDLLTAIVTSISRKEAARVLDEYDGDVEAALAWLESDEYHSSYRHRGGTTTTAAAATATTSVRRKDNVNRMQTKKISTTKKQKLLHYRPPNHDGSREEDGRKGDTAAVNHKRYFDDSKQNPRQSVSAGRHRGSHTHNQSTAGEHHMQAATDTVSPSLASVSVSSSSTTPSLGMMALASSPSSARRHHSHHEQQHPGAIAVVGPGGNSSSSGDGHHPSSVITNRQQEQPVIVEATTVYNDDDDHEVLLRRVEELEQRLNQQDHIANREIVQGELMLPPEDPQGRNSAVPDTNDDPEKESLEPHPTRSQDCKVTPKGRRLAIGLGIALVVLVGVIVGVVVALSKCNEQELECQLSSVSPDEDKLSLYNNDLTGTIPTEIGQFTKLNYLWLQDNNLTGTIPTEIGQLTQLTLVSLSRNNLMGTIPTEIGQLTQLNWLYLYDNQLTGDFTCPDFIDTCYISCNDGTNDVCRSL